MDDASDLTRFLDAQDGVYEQALQELRSGEKRSHWMWFVFPQIAGLGRSTTARHYAIKNVDEARKYLEHPVLGTRLLECVKTVNGLQGRTTPQIFGTPDDMKFGSSMTLFELIAGPGSVFSAALDKYCSGRRDSATLNLVRTNGTATDADGA